MANQFIKAQRIVEAALLLLQREIVLPRLVWRLPPGTDFRGALNDTVNLKVPAVLTARQRTMRSATGLTADDLTQTSVPVQLTTHVYQLLNITDEELTLDIVDFARDILQPQIRAVAEGLEDVVATSIESANIPSATQSVDFVEGTDRPYDVLIRARKRLNKLNVPKSNRVFLCGANVEAAMLMDDKLSKVNESGTDDALREAMLGRVAGFTIVGSTAVDDDFGIAFHQTAFGLAVVAPEIPRGAKEGAKTESNGLQMRYLQDYNPTNGTGPVDRSLVDSFAGAVSVEDGEDDTNRRAVLINFEPEA